MTDFESELGSSLKDIADGMDPQGIQRLEARWHATDVSRSRRHHVVGALSGCAAAAAVLVVLQQVGVIGFSHSTPNETRSQSGVADLTPFITAPTKPGEPCPDAHSHSLDELARLSPVPVWIPDADAASLNNLTGAWTCGPAGGSEVPFLTFGDAPVIVSYEPGYDGVDASAWYRAISVHEGDTVETILGQPAWVHPSTKEGPNAEVLVIVQGGVLIRVLANDGAVPVDELVRVAASIRLEQSVK